MSKKIDLSECSTGRDYAEYAQEHGVDVHKNGSYLVAETEKGAAYMPDSSRAMPKPSRQLVLSAFKLIGLGVALVACGALFALVNGWL